MKKALLAQRLAPEVRTKISYYLAEADLCVQADSPPGPVPAEAALDPDHHG
jgi:hypothetical protein